MKLTKILLCAAVAGAMALASSQAEASVLNVSGVARQFGASHSAGGVFTLATRMTPFNNKTIYLTISNAVAHGAVRDVTKQVILPKDGVIAFNPNIGDGNVTGVFYVTNKSGFSFRLSGFDTNDNYWSFMELDTEIPFFGALGFDDDFLDTSSFNEVFSEKSGPSIFQTTITAAALFYAHDDPYLTDGAEFPDNFNLGNNFVIEIRGVLTLSLSEHASINHASAVLTGKGNAYLSNGIFDTTGVVVSGTVTYVGTFFVD